ncbi:spore germination lipoprotein GerD [Jeotgalibacillus campisalis]|uniref:Spore germination protein GerD n=1 Tax=Jeotgalibacillus campisalis TaxID=220754 RepID=A0A0C2RPU1_9BACL|nr:spore germination lipoprotein GerD [Jeotgalibacillus campisalis]KIL52305.1 spore germination protein GerD [Jeotgalibacillus campisalis]
MRKNGMIILFVFALLLTACGGEKASSYEETKQMVIDLLKTNEGKTAVQELLADEEIKKELVLDQEVVQKSIDEKLLSKDGRKFWEETFKDPAFAEVLAKSMHKEHEELIKGLMQDPEYQGMMLDLLKDPSIQEQTLTLMNSQAYREETKKQMIEVMESPLVQKELQDILLEAAKKMGEQSESGSSGGENTEGSSEAGGGSGEGQGGGEGGGGTESGNGS